MTADPIRIVHVLFRFDIGGLENGVINLVNRLEERSYSHVIVCLTDYDRTYCRRVQATNVEFRALHKREGNDPRVWAQMWRVLRETRPHVLHTRNFAALEMQTLGLMCGVKGRVHGEHGWDMNDLDGSNRKYRIARRILGHCAHRFVALSRELERYLVDTVRIPRRKVVQIYNGVDDVKFHPRPEGSHEMLTVGTVGRMKAVKNQTFLCRVFVALMRRRPELAGRVSLILVGSGPLEQDCRSIVNEADCAAHVLFRGDSDAVADDLRSMDVFVLPSLAEGISNTILEAMATGLPVIATAVGGNPDLVADGESGLLLEPDDDAALAAALERYIDDAALRQRHGRHGRERVESHFSLATMIRAYDAEYRALAACRT